MGLGGHTHTCLVLPTGLLDHHVGILVDGGAGNGGGASHVRLVGLGVVQDREGELVRLLAVNKLHLCVRVCMCA